MRPTASSFDLMSAHNELHSQLDPVVSSSNPNRNIGTEHFVIDVISVRARHQEIVGYRS